MTTAAQPPSAHRTAAKAAARRPYTRLLVQGDHRGHHIVTHASAPWLADCDCGALMTVSIYTAVGNEPNGYIQEVPSETRDDVWRKQRLLDDEHQFKSALPHAHPTYYRVRRDHLAVRERIPHVGNRAAYLALVREAKRIGLPRSFKNDLFEHDRAQLLSEDAPASFGWGVRGLGTDLYVPQEGSLNWLDAHIKANGNERYYVFHRGWLRFLGEGRDGASKLYDMLALLHRHNKRMKEPIEPWRYTDEQLARMAEERRYDDDAVAALNDEADRARRAADRAVSQEVMA